MYSTPKVPMMSASSCIVVVVVTVFDPMVVVLLGEMGFLLPTIQMLQTIAQSYEMWHFESYKSMSHGLDSYLEAAMLETFPNYSTGN